MAPCCTGTGRGRARDPGGASGAPRGDRTPPRGPCSRPIRCTRNRPPAARRPPRSESVATHRTTGHPGGVRRSQSVSSLSRCARCLPWKTSLGGPRPSPSLLLPLDQFPHSFRQADRLGPLLDQADRHRRDRGAAVIPVQPYPTVLPDVDPTPGQVHDQGHHAPLLADHPRHLGRRDLDHHAAGQAPGLALLHRQLDALDLVDAQDMTHDHVADLQVPCRVAEFYPPGRFRRVEGSGIGRVDVDEPMGWALVDHFADDGIAPLRDVSPVERDHADDALVLVPNAQLCRQNLSAFDVCAPPGFQPRAADSLVLNYNLAERPTALHWYLSLTQRVETEAAT